MIISQLSGGLGNQLFQYAYGYSRALELGVEFKIDLSFYETYEWHTFSLNPFNISAKIANTEEISFIKSLDHRFQNKIMRKLNLVNPHCINEKNLLFNPKYLSINKQSYVTGYWQSEKYFLDNLKNIFNEFSIKILPTKKNQELINDIISEKESVSLHIRRGNYVDIEHVNKIHGTVSLEYYELAINYFLKNVISPKFYIFSDDIRWAQKNLKLNKRVLFVDINDDLTDYEDLRLMSLCKNNIIANSTFSWWGAYLNSNANKIVFAPKKWFADSKKNFESKNIIPDNWKKIG
jgi:hypothetical protein